MTPERQAHRVGQVASAWLLAGECENAGKMKRLGVTRGQAVEDDATSSRTREDSASGRNLEGPPTAGSAYGAADCEAEGALPITRESERTRSNAAYAACSGRRAGKGNRLPSLDPAESGQLARSAERVFRVRPTRGVVQVRLEDVHAWRDRDCARRGKGGHTSEHTARDGEEDQRDTPHPAKLHRVGWHNKRARRTPGHIVHSAVLLIRGALACASVLAPEPVGDSLSYTKRAFGVAN
jgi:hypothetical protein